VGRGERAGLVIVRDGAVALIERHREGHDYWIFPGGGVEPGETLEVAAVREAAEELGLAVRLGRRILELHEEWFGRTVQHFFLAEATDAHFGEMTGPERDEQSATNRYRRAWVPVQDVPALELLPTVAKDMVVAVAGGGEWPGDTVVVHTDDGYP
jgi:8-oxo-dGTP diphosphatase